jgi:aryl carrier-like protein
VPQAEPGQETLHRQVALVALGVDAVRVVLVEEVGERGSQSAGGDA